MLDVPVGIDKIGMLVVGGLNLIAAGQLKKQVSLRKARQKSILLNTSRLLTFNDAV